MSKELETLWGKGAGSLYLVGLGCFFLSIAIPEEWKQFVRVIGVSLLALGVFSDGVDATLSGRFNDLDEEISQATSPLSFIFSILFCFSLLMILIFFLINAWLSADLGASVPDLKDVICPELLLFGFSLLFLSYAMISLSLGVIRFRRSSGSFLAFSGLRIRRKEQPFFFYALVALNFLISGVFAWFCLRMML